MASPMASKWVLCLIFFPSFFNKIHANFSEQVPQSEQGKGSEKLTRLHFYFHEILDGKNPSSVRILPAVKKSGGGFGTAVMMDDSLMEGPEPSSKLVGRAQGLYAFASQHDVGLLMVLTFSFTEGFYNGSSLSILGRNPILNHVRDMPVVGGSGRFRFARGYALAKTFTLDPKSGNVVVEYNVTVMHH